MAELALFGGTPARRNPFLSSVVTGETEQEYINEVLRRKEFSRFVGSPDADIDKTLVMPSAEAVGQDCGGFHFLGGAMVRRFEADFACKFNAPFAISVNSATSGLITALGACGVSAGEEVITTCLSFNATATSILIFNALPVFADVEERTFCLNPQEIAKKITAKSKAIIVVHLLGHAADMQAIMKIARAHQLVVIEDCAQSPGVQYKGTYVGTIGDMGVFSFQETKNITTGEGGMIVTSNPLYAKKCRLIRNHGESVPDINSLPEDLINNIGFNFRMTELTAALGVAQLRRLEENNRIRKENAAYLAEHLRGLPGLYIPQAVTSAGNICHIFPAVYNEQTTGVPRARVVQALRAEGIPVGTGYARLMPENPLFTKKIAYGIHRCPFSCPLGSQAINYDGGDYPLARNYIYNKFIWFFYVNAPNTLKDMQDVAGAFKKVWASLDRLKDYQLSSQERYISGRKQGERKG